MGNEVQGKRQVEKEKRKSKDDAENVDKEKGRGTPRSPLPFGVLISISRITNLEKEGEK